MKLPTFKLTGPNIFNVVGGIIIIYLLIVLGQTVKRNYDLGRQIEQLGAQIALLQDQKDQLSYSLQYYSTDSYRDKEARSKLGLQLPGENVVIIPSASPTPNPAADQSKNKPTGPRSNFGQWLDFLAGRQS